MAGERSFYGGAAPTGALGGELSAGHYDGPEAYVLAPWKCPACGVENGGRLELGCVSCGAGQPGFHVEQSPPPRLDRQAAPVVRFHREPTTGATAEFYALAERWAEHHPTASLAEAFAAGYVFATTGEGMDFEALAPEGKPRRTLAAALELFKDQILSQQPEEIASGEWCSVEEAEALIAQLRAEGGGT